MPFSGKRRKIRRRARLAIEPVTTAALIAGGSALLSSLSSSKGEGGKKGGSSQAELRLPRSFRRVAAPLGKSLRAAILDPSFQRGLQQGTSFFSNVLNNPDAQAALQAYRDTVEDPTKLTDPLFQQERERLAASLSEESRRRGGLFSTGSADLVGRGLSDFTARYLSDAANRRLGAASGLLGGTLNLGEAQFTPFRFFSSALPGFTGSPSVLPPAQFNNAKGQLAGTLGQIGSKAALSGKGGSSPSSPSPSPSLGFGT